MSRLSTASLAVLLSGLLIATAQDPIRSSQIRVKRIVGGTPAEVPPRVERETTAAPETSTEAEKDPLVFVRRDRRSAVVNGLKNSDGTYAYLGIHYAEPPIKRLRFQRPRKLKLKGVVNAKKFGPPCPQWFNGQIIGQEDCLYLNVFTPQAPSANGTTSPAFPVLLWIHGGNFQTGSAAQYLPKDLVKKGVVVVTVQYRLGSLGFLSLGRKELPGNVGLFDIATAARWVKDYIRFFGGDPQRVVPAGHGSGASCASFLAMNPNVRNNVKGVFAMSGSPVSPFTLDESEVRTAKEVSELDGCYEKDDIKFVRCMQNLPLETVLKGDKGVQNNRKERYDYSKELSNLLTPGPNEEGKEDSRFLSHFLPQSPLSSLKEGNFPKVPLLTGVTKDETGAGVKGNFFDEIKRLLTPDFLKGGLFKDLLNANTGLYVNKTVDPGLSKLFNTGTYVQFFSKIVSSVLGEFEQVIQHTTDAFFNLPAFITSHLWSQKNKVYLYSFEHKTKPTASNFLPGLPLVPNQQKSEEPACNHGDDLRFLFDIQSLEGNPIGNSTELNDADKKVKDHFTTMVAEFARSGAPKTQGGETWTPFSKDNGNYMVISEKPKLEKGFRKCSMALWTGDTNMLGSVECGLAEAGKIVTSTLGAAGTQILKSVTAIEGRLGSAVTGGIGKAGEAVKTGQQVTGALTNRTTEALEGLGIPPLTGGGGGGGGDKKGNGWLGGLVPKKEQGASGDGSGRKGGLSGLLGGGQRQATSQAPPTGGNKKSGGLFGIGK